MSDAPDDAGTSAKQGSPSGGALPADVYAQICTNIRATDDISFKLLGFVPVVSGAAIAFLVGSKTANFALVTFVSLFAAIVTLGFFRWELRNVQTCRWLRRLAEGMDHRVQPNPPTFLWLPIGKKEAETMVYWSTIAAWLVLPGVLSKRWTEGLVRTAVQILAFLAAALLLSRLAERARRDPKKKNEPPETGADAAVPATTQR